ncbi:MAG: hypothetical protein C0593_04685 [Marinilabiliales bacterium]|nr:MAG: hypothetical protein C0593_04685 [Marinilabiliales bacterium]
MKKTTLLLITCTLFQITYAQLPLDSCLYSLIGLDRNHEKVQYFIEKSGLQRQENRLNSLFTENESYSLTLSFTAGNKVSEFFIDIYTDNISAPELPLLEYFGVDTYLQQSLSKLHFPITDTLDYSFMKRMGYLFSPEPDLRAQLRYTKPNQEEEYTLSTISLNGYAPASFCESCYPESAGFGMAEIEKEPIKKPASIWKKEYITTASFDSICELFKLRPNTTQWSELVSKFGFRESHDGDDFWYTSKDGNLKIYSNEYNISRIRSIKLYINDPADVTFIDHFSDLKKEAYGYKHRSWNYDWFSALCYSGNPDDKHNLYYVYFYTPNEKDKFTYVTIEPLYYYEYNYTGRLKTIENGCLEGNCNNGTGYFQWTNGLNFKGEFENGKPVEGYYYHFAHGNALYDSISRKETMKYNIRELAREGDELEQAALAFSKEMINVTTYMVRISNNEGNRSENRNQGMKHLGTASRKLLNVRREAQTMLDALHRSGIDCPKAYDRISSIGGDFNSAQATLLIIKDYFNGQGMSQDEVEKCKSLGNFVNSIGLQYIYDQLNACIE